MMMTWNVYVCKPPKNTTIKFLFLLTDSKWGQFCFDLGMLVNGYNCFSQFPNRARKTYTEIGI